MILQFVQTTVLLLLLTLVVGRCSKTSQNTNPNPNVTEQVGTSVVVPTINLN